MTSGASVKVAVRCRPLTANERAKVASRVVKMSGEKTIIHNPNQSAGTKEHTFTFDHSYFWETKTDQIYHECVESLLKEALLGHNVTVVAFGQTGSGKTYLIAGTEEEQGLAPLLNQNLFKLIEEAPPSKQFFVTVSAYEIFQEGIHDLLNPSGQELRVRLHPQLGMFVEGLCELVVHNAEDIASLYEQSCRVRRMASVDKSNHNVRSHSVFTIDLEQKQTERNEKGLKSRITIVDMAGSDISYTGTREEIKEDCFVEKSIGVFSTILNTLSDKKKRQGHVPYRDSTITRILQDSFGGNSVTLLVGTLSPVASDFEASLAALQVCSIAKKVENTVKKNEIENTKIMQELRNEITRLRDKLSSTGITKAPNKDDVLKMEELIYDLNMAKRQTWEEKEHLSEQYDEERRINMSNKGILDWVMDSLKKDNKEVQEKLMALQKEKDQITVEYKEKRKQVDEMKDDLQTKIVDYSKLTESGKGSEEESKKRVSEIHELKENLKAENENLKKMKHRLKELQEKMKSEKEEARSQSSGLKGNAELMFKVEAEQRDKLEKETAATLADEIDRVNMETEQQKAELQLKAAEGFEYNTPDAVKIEMELVEIKAERQVMSLKIKSLEDMKKRLQHDLEEVQRRHKKEMEIQQLQHFQVFRNYRDVFEEQKAAIEQRYRTLLEESIQDAVFLSTYNQELLHENQVLKQENAELKDQLQVLEGAERDY